MRRDILLLTEMIDAAEQARQLAHDITASQLDQDRQRHDALLWNSPSSARPPARSPTRSRPDSPG
jgi:hypothetical protein